MNTGGFKMKIIPLTISMIISVLFLPFEINAITIKSSSSQITKDQTESYSKIEVFNVPIKEVKNSEIISKDGKAFTCKKECKVIKSFKNNPKIAEIHLLNGEVIMIRLKGGD